MKTVKKTETKMQDASKVRELSPAQVRTIAGGLNPQPLPPRE